MLADHFICRGYPPPLILKSLERMEKLDHKSLLDKQLLESTNLVNWNTTSEKNFYCVSTHNPINPPLRDIITKNWEILGKTKTTRPLLDTKIIFRLRRNKNLSDQLVRASTSHSEESRPLLADTRLCHKKDSCRYCPLLNTSGKFTCKIDGNTAANLT